MQSLDFCGGNGSTMIGKEDLISKLPDEILESIISLLSVSEAGRTCVLCRRWEKVWMKTFMFSPTLVFNDSVKFRSFMGPMGPSDSSDCEKYIKGVNRVMELHKAPTIKELAIGFALTLQCSSSLNKWIEFAAQKRVQKLKLDLYSHLQNVSKKRNCRFSSGNRRLYWWRLRDCYMSKVNVDDQDVKCLISNSPNLERLCVRDSLHIVNLQVENAPKLEYLEIRRCRTLQSLHIISTPSLKDLFMCNFEGCTRLPYRCLVRISCAPNLERLRFCGVVGSHSPLVFDIPLPPHLSHAYLGLMETYGADIEFFHELFAQFPQVKRIRLDMERKVFLDIATRNDTLLHFPQELTSLEDLEISITSHSELVSFMWLCSLVKASPFLNTLSIKLSYLASSGRSIFKFRLIDLEWKDEDIHNKVKANISHSHHSLKVVELVGFTGFRNQVELVLHLAEVAVSLEKIIIDVRVPKDYWGVDILVYIQNSFAEKCRACAQLLKTQIQTQTRPGIDVVII